jgi:hypothetical protein
MTPWTFLTIGLVALFGVSVLVGLCVAAILGQIGREASYLLDSESWPRVTRSPRARPAQLGLGSQKLSASRLN